MRTYDVYQGQECAATVSVHEDGWIAWEFAPAWSDFWSDRDNRCIIEEALKHVPDEPLITSLGFIIRQRAAEP
jgi:hypothetical protein